MLTNRPFRFGLLTLLCVMLLVVRVGGMHLHFCFDGGEPRVSLHGFDGELHHFGPNAAPVHQDVDVSLAGDALGKPDKVKFDLPIFLIGALALLQLLLPKVVPGTTAVPRFILAVRVFLRPPLRGPPLPLPVTH